MEGVVSYLPQKYSSESRARKILIWLIGQELVAKPGRVSHSEKELPPTPYKVNLNL